MEETLTSEEDQSPAAAEEKGDSVYHLNSDLIMCFNHLVVRFSSFDFRFTFSI